jgi:hypothetical protein
MTGREALKCEVRELNTLLTGTLEDTGTWRKGSWTIDMAKIAR